MKASFVAYEVRSYIKVKAKKGKKESMSKAA
jgi:hypothetical protein